ncbi:conserved hypothetical protein [Bathymodiolus platifrons methanotrophic gill symbiont]|nr:conserved hypothetical protein [Bathymodiolus platifrons methanotrophic gill symbiont]GFO74316.1 tRNA 2-thiouridine synthesizing protein B [Bathymodiolus platifrons methanotrophic gill symbiont]
MLHIISTTAGHEVLFERIAKGDTLLFIASAVLSLHKNSLSAEKLLPYCAHFHCYVLEEDLLARGLDADDILAEIKRVDYPGFVSLTVENEVIKTWN